MHVEEEMLQKEIWVRVKWVNINQPKKGVQQMNDPTVRLVWSSFMGCSPGVSEYQGSEPQPFAKGAFVALK